MLGAVWREWPAFGLGAFLFLVALVGLIGMTERRRISAFQMLTVLSLLALLALAETAVQKIVVGALDSYEARCRTCHEIAEPATATG